MEPLRIIDCHNHSLPFIDDGAVDLEMALAMLTVAEQSGTTDVVLTPHHLNG
ncbi:MAG: protein-tyrosine phosphatase, partial [Arenicella sp.]